MKNEFQITTDRIVATRMLADASMLNARRFFISESQPAGPLAATARERQDIGLLTALSSRIRPVAFSVEVAANYCLLS